MKTYNAMIKTNMNGASRTLQTQIRALNVADAKLLLQAIYGFHALASIPSEVRESKKLEDIITPKSAQQQRIDNLKTAKKRADDALKAERDRQKKQHALSTLSGLNLSNAPQ